MGHYAYLNGCQARDFAARYVVDKVIFASDPELEAKSLIPLFWLVEFGSADLLSIRHGGDEWIALCASTPSVTATLARRRMSILAQLPAAFANYFDE